MKLYIASSFDLIPKVLEVEEAVENDFHTITTKWWAKDKLDMHGEKNLLNSETFYQHPFCSKIFARDYEGIRKCDALILVADDIPKKYNGANIELGIAYGFGKTCLSIGKLENCALYHPVIKCEDIPQLIKRLDWLSNVDDRNDSRYDDIYDDMPDCIESDSYYNR